MFSFFFWFDMCRCHVLLFSGRAGIRLRWWSLSVATVNKRAVPDKPLFTHLTGSADIIL